MVPWLMRAEKSKIKITQSHYTVTKDHLQLRHQYLSVALVVTLFLGSDASTNSRVGKEEAGNYIF